MPNIKKYYFTKTINCSFENAIQKIKDSLKEQGFGILTEIDMKSILLKKLQVDFHSYTILGACNPLYAYAALQAEDKIGTMLPCNVIIQEKMPGMVELSAIDPAASMQSIKNKKLQDIAEEVGMKLEKAILHLN